MTSEMHDIRKFHEKFFPDLVPTECFVKITDSLAKMKLEFILEELTELAAAMGFTLTKEGDSFSFVKTSETFDFPEILDAIVDIQYVVLGTALSLGFFKKIAPNKSSKGSTTVLTEAWDRVQRANMSKIRVSNATESKRSSLYDVKKPTSWQPPNFDDLVPQTKEQL